MYSFYRILNGDNDASPISWSHDRQNERLGLLVMHVTGRWNNLHADFKATIHYRVEFARLDNKQNFVAKLFSFNVGWVCVSSESTRIYFCSVWLFRYSFYQTHLDAHP